MSDPGHDSAYLVELRQFVGSLALDSPTAARCAELLGRQVPTARCHGDLVPWNVGLVPGSAVLWDFEYSAADAPAGFDAVQGRYRLARESGTEIREALIAAAHNAEPVLRRLGLDAAERAMVGALHALDAARRIHDGVDARGTEPSDFTVAVAAALDIGAKRG